MLSRINSATDTSQALINRTFISFACYQNANIMVPIKIMGDWNVLKGKLKQKFGNLTDDDLMFIKGKEDELIGRIQQKIGKTKREIQDLLSKL